MSPRLGIDARLANESQRHGVGRFCTEILRALPIVAPDLKLELYLDSPPAPDFPKLPDANTSILPRVKFWTHRALGAQLRSDPADVFFSPTMQMPLRCPVPSVVAVHDLAFLNHQEYFTPRQRATARLQCVYVMRRATRLLCVSEATKQHVMDAYHVPPERITVSGEGYAPQFQPLHDTEILERVRSKYGLPERFVLYVGRLQPRKNLPRLMEAFHKVRARQPELSHKLVIAGGKGWMYEEILQKSNGADYKDLVQMLGFVDDADLPALVNLADALALVSLWEGFGLPVLEAMACGTPVITSDRSSLPEVAGDAAVLVDPLSTDSIATGLERLLLDAALRAQLSARGLEQARLFSWENAARKLVEAAEAAARESNFRS